MASEKIVKDTRDLINQKNNMLAKINTEQTEDIKLREQEQMQLNKRIAEIKLKVDGKITCLFNPSDPIFFLEDQAQMPSEEEK